MNLDVNTKFDLDTNSIVLLTVGVMLAGLFLITIARLSKK